MTKNPSLKILMILHMPWSRNLGGARVQLELAEEFQSLGHQVEKFDLYDAFPQYKPSLWTQLTYPDFSVKAKEFVRANAHRFDIIDAHQGNLPFTKQELGFQGLLVSRSVGLYAFYDEFKKQQSTKQKPQKLKTRLGNSLRSWKHKRKSFLCPHSFKTCDLINVPNHDELAYIRDVMRLGEKCRVFTFGLSQRRKMAFAEAIKPVEVRLANKQVAFIGSWGIRKGSKDWAEIIKRVKAKVPKASFLFLGTGVNRQKILTEIGLPGCNSVRVVPNYNSNELPKLLSKATIGAFPSYIEGFGFAVLEKLACGIPTIAYDIPGPREMLKYFDDSFMVPVGDIEQFSNRIVDLLNLDTASYSRISQRSLEIASKFAWNNIAKETLDTYSRLLKI